MQMDLHLRRGGGLRYTFGSTDRLRTRATWKFMQISKEIPEHRTNRLARGGGTIDFKFAFRI